MKAVIQAGGKGTRLKEITGDCIPKPLAQMNGRSILEIQILQLKQYGIDEVYIIVNHLGQKIVDYLGEEQYGIRITYIFEKSPLGSAGALYYVKQYVRDEDFLLIFGDIIFDIDWNRMLIFHTEKQALATLFVHPNSHPKDSDIVIADRHQKVIAIDSKEKQRNYWYSNKVNAGLYILSGKILDDICSVQRLDLEKDLLSKWIKKGEGIYAYLSTEYVKDAGTVERFKSVEQDLIKRIPQRRNLSNRQKCIFIDRDGTVNEYCGLISKEEQIRLLDCSIEAIKKINMSGYLVILVTNQPVVARGLCTMEEVEQIHRKIETLLGEAGAYLDDIIFCPHHPDKGFPEENPIYKVECDCRKPKIGMIRSMQRKYNIDLSSSYMIGDTTVDVMTGINAGMKTILVETGEAGKDGKYEVAADKIARDLLQAVNDIVD
ncbi:MAG: HAD-IIIA family hydrolase [Lachnospiraceae bacterium]|nr:HAD-IIIA family hydrolase [Lachnospiraceae bacterium]